MQLSPDLDLIPAASLSGAKQQSMRASHGEGNRTTSSTKMRDSILRSPKFQLSTLGYI